MRKITRKSALAFLESELRYNRTFTEGNTTVAKVWGVDTTGRGMFLHGHLIAHRAGIVSPREWNLDSAIYLTLAGRNTRTTRDRLNGILELMDKPWRFVQQGHSPYLLDTRKGTGSKISHWEQIEARTGQITNGNLETEQVFGFRLL